MFEDLSLALPFASSAAESELDLAAIVETYSTLLFRVANSIVHNATEAEDIVQDVFTRVVQHKRSLPDIRDLRVWLVRIAWNIALDHQRRTKPDQIDDAQAALLAGTLPAVDRTLGNAQQIDTVLRAIDLLPKGERQALSLSALEELNTDEIAHIMGKSESAVRALIFRARTHLRERLSKKGAKA